MEQSSMINIISSILAKGTGHWSLGREELLFLWEGKTSELADF